MSGNTWWDLSRILGMTAWGLLSLSVVVGLVMTSRMTRGRAKWLTDLHTWLSGMAVTGAVLHVAMLVPEAHADLPLSALVIPFASTWERGAMTLGVLALYLLLTVEATSLLRRHLANHTWRLVHFASFGLFWFATFHLLLLGTDATAAAFRWTVDVVVVAVVFLTLYRVLSRLPGLASHGRRTPPAPPRAA